MNFSAVLLAGGESRRMGQDKAALVFEGEPLWRRQLQLLRQLAPEEIFVSARSDPEWRPQDIKLVLDKPPPQGPMSGIYAALSTMSNSHLIVLAVDMPFLLKDDLQNLVSHAGEACGVVPVTHEHYEPLAAVYPRDAMKELVAALSSNDRSLQRLLERLVGLKMMKFVRVSQIDVARYRSVNTPADL
ncbi:MAG: hypothetical protein DLM52_10240 [Chthoniobacterales bacterium]|nr:MAG: hypothetical protein DLM52_10240 [Chthoniobacterales bacterium]